MLQSGNVIVNLCVNLARLQHNAIESNIRLDVAVVPLLSHVRLFVTPWTVACQASWSLTISQSLLKLMSIQSLIPSNHLILCHLLPSIFPTFRVFFSSESALHVTWPKYWSFNFGFSPSNKYSRLISFRVDWFDFHAI